MELPGEYTTLFNAITDAIEALEKLVYELKLAQNRAEDQVIRREEP